MEKWIKSERIYQGRVVSLRTGDVQMDDGTIAFREVVEHPGGCAIVPVLGDSVVLIRQFRIAIGRDILELPAGKIELDDAHPEERARAELEEETGYRAGSMLPAGIILPSVGYTSERIHLFLAFDLTKTQQNLEEDECVELQLVPIAEIEERIASNEIQDAKTIIGLQALLRHLNT